MVCAGADAGGDEDAAEPGPGLLIRAYVRGLQPRRRLAGRAQRGAAAGGRADAATHGLAGRAVTPRHSLDEIAVDALVLSTEAG